MKAISSGSQNLGYCLGIRCFAIALTALAYLSVKVETFYSIYFAIAMAHYLGGVIYSRHQATQVFSNQRAALFFLFLIPLSLLVFYAKVSPVMYFGIHHVLTEIYMANRFVGKEGSSEKNTLMATRIPMLTFCYLYLMRYSPEFPPFLPVIFIKLGVIVSIPGFLVHAYLTWTKDKKIRILQRFIIFEIAMLIVWSILLATVHRQIGIDHVIFYHGVCWFLYPLPKIMKSEKWDFVKFSAAVIIPAGLALGLTPLGESMGYMLAGSAQILDVKGMRTSIMFWGYLHISLSFALSSSNPVWIRKLYNIMPGSPALKRAAD